MEIAQFFASENVINFTMWVAMITLCVGFIAGFVDSTVGGGGLIAFPCLLFLGLPPHIVLATNKFQAIFGTISATVYFHKKGMINIKAFFPLAFFLTTLWAICGVFVLRATSNSMIEKIVPVIMTAILIYRIVYFKHGLHPAERPILTNMAFITIFTALLGFYDGFFGPGVGSLWIFAFVTFLGMNSLQASANTKILNLASNIGAILIFIPTGMICYKIGLTMGIGQVFGAKFGVYISMKKGAKFINIMFIMIMLLLVIRLFAKVYFK